MHFLVACYATLHPALSARPSVCPTVRPSVHHTLLFLVICGVWPHSISPNEEVTSIIAPAHPHATGVAVYPALFWWSQAIFNRIWHSKINFLILDFFIFLKMNVFILLLAISKRLKLQEPDCIHSEDNLTKFNFFFEKKFFSYTRSRDILC